jgi:hypothetical protein
MARILLLIQQIIIKIPNKNKNSTIIKITAWTRGAIAPL